MSAKSMRTGFRAFWLFCLRALGLALGVAVGAAAPADAQDRRAVDLELALAVDASGSVSDEEFSLQVRGLAEAFRHRSVGQAIRAAGDLGLAAALIQWSDHRSQVLAVDWTVIHDEKTAGDFAEKVENISRSVAGNTAIGSVLEFAIPQFAANGFQGRRMVIDISGDGRTNEGPESWLGRDAAVAHGITVNGLAILNEDPTLDHYYLTNVVGGTGAFVMTANHYGAFREAIVAKLIKEISGAPLAQRPAPPSGVLTGPDIADNPGAKMTQPGSLASVGGRVFAQF